MKRRHFRFSVLIPLAFIAVSLWLLVGCLYIPTPEITYRTGSKKDFRPLVGEVGSGKPIVAGKITRAGVEAILGPPPYESANHRRLMYVIHAEKDVWIMPLCFTVGHANDRALGLVLNFDEGGLLTGWQQFEGSHALVSLNVVWNTAEEMLVFVANGNQRGSLPTYDEWTLQSTKDVKRH